METENSSGQNQSHVQNPMNADQDGQNAERHIKAVNEEQEQVKELLRRGVVRHYFCGPETIWTREGFGIVVGGVLAIVFGGFIFPKLFLYSSNSDALMIVCRIITAVGVVVLAKGIYDMYRESKKESKPVPDKVHDEILEHDIAGIKKTSISMLEQHIPSLKGGFDDMETVLVKGPRDYSGFVNLPLMWRLGGDGKLRYSNFSVMALYFGKEILYIYTCIFNMRNGMPKFHHTYECPYDQIRFAGFEDRTFETVTQNNKNVTQNLKMLVIDAGEGESGKLSMPVADYDMMKNLKGTIDYSDAEEAVKMLTGKMRAGESK